MENAEYGKITCVSLVMYLLSAFYLFFPTLLSLNLKTQPECQLFKHDLKEQRNYSIMFMIYLKHIYIQNLKSLEVYLASFPFLLNYTHIFGER